MAPQISLVTPEGPVTAPLPATSPLAVSGLTVSYHRQPAVWNVDFVAPPGQRTAIIGPNGAGKSTFLKAALGLIPRLAGEVRVFGQPVERQRRRIAYVPQRESVDWDFPASALDVVAMGLYPRIGWFRPVTHRHRDRARACLDQIGLADFADRQIGQLSGGQQQRVFLARALAQEADLYVMDEPFTGVDATTERAIADLMCRLRDSGRSVICVHHALETVGAYFDHALILNVRKIAAGPVADTVTEAHLATAYGGRFVRGMPLAAVSGR